jgi:hypothetical protein
MCYTIGSATLFRNIRCVVVVEYLSARELLLLFARASVYYYRTSPCWEFVSVFVLYFILAESAALSHT